MFREPEEKEYAGVDKDRGQCQVFGDLGDTRFVDEHQCAREQSGAADEV